MRISSVEGCNEFVTRDHTSSSAIGEICTLWFCIFVYACLCVWLSDLIE